MKPDRWYRRFESCAWEVATFRIRPRLSRVSCYIAMVSQNGHPQSSGGRRDGLSGARRLDFSNPLLSELCELYGVQTGYRDTRGKWRESPVESIVAILRALGADLGDQRAVGDRQVSAAIRERKRELGRRLIEPVLVAWEGRSVLTKVPPAEWLVSGCHGRARGNRAKLTLTLEDGTETSWECPIAAGESVSVRKLPRLPYGYHKLVVEYGTSLDEAAVISAPRRCWRPEAGESRRPGEGVARAAGAPGALAGDWPDASVTDPLKALEGRPWGIFAPLYALRSERDWGAGDLAELRALRDWVGSRGGCVVSTLPLLAMFFNEPFDPSPYRPVSRLFWNEFYLAVEQIPEWDRCTAARELWASADVQAELRALRAEPLVDYRGVMGLKRRVLERMAEDFFSNPGPEGRDAATARRKAFERHLREHPLAQDYATFRAGREDWPSADSAAAAKRYHLYCQWQMEEQLGRFSGGDGPDLFLDLPLGVHPDGFDAWRWPELFARGMSTGAPPDDFFAKGQDWALPPLHPERIREDGHQYFARCLRHHMRHAGYLRIDHIMSLHRLFWVPEGMEATDGVYVNYPTEDLYAVLCLESHRNRTVVVGEDLGTVSPGVRSTMRRHGVLRSWVLQTSLRPRAAQLIAPVPQGSVASLNTHDMFPFAGFLGGRDIEVRVQTGQLDEQRAHRATAARTMLIARLYKWAERQADTAAALGCEPVFAASTATEDPAHILRAVLAHLANSPARLTLVNLEDLELETHPQNVPGTVPSTSGDHYGNWRRRLRKKMSRTNHCIP